MKDVSIEERAKLLSDAITKMSNDKKIRRRRYVNRKKRMSEIKQSDYICYSKLK